MIRKNSNKWDKELKHILNNIYKLNKISGH